VVLPDRRILERPVGVELAVLKHERHLELARREVDRVLDRVAQEVQPREPHLDVQARHAHRVVVVPEETGLLVVR
jgi:hypothetical protein